MRPALKHMVIFVVASAAIALFAAFLGFIITGLMNGGIVAGRPLGQLHVAIYALDPAVYVNVESLSDEARLSLCWPVIISTIPLVLAVAGGGLALYYYSIWIFQGINQRMRVTLSTACKPSRSPSTHLPGRATRSTGSTRTAPW